MDNCKLILLVGLPGSGKSTLANQLVAEGYARVSADQCRKDLFGDESIQGGADLWNYFYAMLRQALLCRRFVVVDNTNIRPKDRATIIEMGKAAGFEVEIWHVDTPIDECLKRNANRERKVPEEVIIRMGTTLAQHPPTREEAPIKRVKDGRIPC